jgi:diaminopimelate decarboxylase
VNDPSSRPLARLTPERIARVARAALGDEALSGERALLVHDLDALGARLRALRAAYPANAMHAVAIKANPVVAILREVVAAGCGLEAASIEELHLALAAGCAPARIVFDSPAKTRAEIDEALTLGVRLNADNPDELARIEASAALASSSSIVGLRVNPGVGSGKISATSVAGRGSRFGVPIAQAHELYARHEWLRAVHAHVGSQGCSMDQLVEAARRVEALREEVGAARLRHVDLGGGLPVAYLSGDDPPGFSAYTAALREAAPGLFAPEVELITEFGRAVHANCGWGLSRVEYVKPAGDAVVAVGHLGADLLLRPVYAAKDWSHEFLALTPDGELKGGPTREHTLAGPLCFGGDVIAQSVQLPALEPGDWLVVRDAGAYTLSMWSRHCSRGIPAVVGARVAGDEVTLSTLRRAERPEDVVRFWS